MNKAAPVMMRRPLFILICGVLLSCLAVAVTASTVLARRAPQTALMLWPVSAEAASRQAEALITQGAPTSIDWARRLAEQALRRQPVNVVAARTLAIIASQQGQVRRTERLLAIAEWLSRRDLPTQVALIESQVQNGNVPAALIHYDRAMQTSVQSRAVLLPVLTGASDDPEIVRPLATLLAGRPWWWQDFFDRFARTSRNPASFARIAAALRLRPAAPGEAERLGIAINHLVGLGDIGRAVRLYETARSRTGSPVHVRDGGFESDTALPPFEWAYVDDDEHAGIREYRDGATGKAALSLTGAAAGAVARQLLVLPAGRYVLSAKIGQVATGGGTAPSISLSCFDGATVPSQVIITAAMPPAQAATVWRVPFDVAVSHCPAQWFSINAGANVDPTGSSPWIDDILIESARP